MACRLQTMHSNNNFRCTMWVGNRETIILKVVAQYAEIIFRGIDNLRKIKSICKAKKTLNYRLKTCAVLFNKPL